MLRFLICLSMLLGWTAAFGQDDVPDKAPSVTQEDIDQQRRTMRSVLEEAEALRVDPELSHSINTERHLLDEIRTDGLRGLIESLTDNPDQRGQQDLIDSILAAGEQESNATQANSYNPMNPLVLVSFSMPQNALVSALTEAKRLGAAVYLRGFLNDDVNQTIDRLVELSQDSEYALSIDPTVFTRFDVESVPSYILPIEPVIPCDDSDCNTPEHVRATGAAGLQYFFDLVKRTGEPAEKAAAIAWLEQVDDES